MFSITLKRSAATLGVVAGLLAAAGPASAQILDGPVLAKAGFHSTDASIHDWIEMGCPNWLRSRPSVDPPIRADAGNGHAGFCGVDVSADHIEAYVVTNNNDPDAMAIARGTQVGSEGVKAANNLRGEAIDIIP
jgi:hypothetical protein